jgi:hypothetical protein
MSVATANRVTKLNGEQTSNGGKAIIDMSQPYIASVTLLGTAPLLFHAWNVEAVAEKAKAAKGSKAKKSDDVESYVYRWVSRYPRQESARDSRQCREVHARPAFAAKKPRGYDSRRHCPARCDRAV